MKRAFWILITPLAGFLVLWLIGSMLIAPKLEAWALNKIQTYSDSSLPVKIRAEKLQLKLFKPSLALEGIDVEAKGELAEALKPVRVGSVRVFIDFFHLLSGRVTLSAVVVDSPDVEINIDPFLKSDAPPKELPLNALFNQLDQLPLHRLFIQNLHLKVTSKDLKLQGEIQSGDLLATNMGKHLTAKANVPQLNLDLEKIGSFQGSLDTHLYLTRQSLRIIQMGVRLDESEVLVRGELTQFHRVTIKPSGLLDVSARLHLSDLYTELKKIRPDLKLPTFSGEVNLDAEARFNGLDQLRGKADIKTRALMVDKFELGDARIQGEYRDKKISLSEIRVQHPAGEAVMTKTQMSIGQNFDFKTHVSVHDLDLQKLFISLNLNNVPVGVDLQGELPCEGHLHPSFEFTCSKASLKAQNLWVKSSLEPKATAILDINSMSAEGQVKVTTEAVTYAAGVSIGDSTGHSDGVIDFAKGFKINFKTDKLEFKNVKNLSNLKLEGSASMEGSTSGDSNAAIFDMKVNAREFTFEDFYLGNLISNLKYRSGRLIFEDVAGAIRKTQYLGDLEVNLDKNTLTGDFSIPTAELPDVASVFTRIYKFPVDVQGQGSAKASVRGPLNFWKMNYELQSAFKNVSIGPETFDTLNFNVTARDGNIHADKVTLQRAGSIVLVQGGISSSQILNLNADGKNFKLEESDTISKINSSIAGNLNFAAELTGPVKNPQVLVKGAVTDSFFEDQEIPNSNFIVRLNLDTVFTQLSLFGGKVQGEFQLPFEKGRAPLMVKMQTREWNYSTLLGLVGGANLASEYTSSLTSTVDLRSESGDIFKSSGKVHIDALELRRGTLSLKNPQAIDIVTDNGVASIRNFRLEGPNTELAIRGENFTAQNMNIAVNMNSDLRLLHIFMPFLEDLGGPIKVSTNMTGSVTKPQIMGTLNANNTYIKIKGFPHPLERLNVDVVFSQSRVMVNSIRGNIAGGTLTGDGGILINEIKDIPTTIRLRLDNVTLNVPEKVRTNGNADLVFSGRWFPFTLSGTYAVNSALVEKEFTEDSGGVAGVKQSLYLPKVIRESRFEPVLLDINILMNRNIIVKNSLLDGAVSGNLQVKGPPTNPVLLGRINAEKNSKLIFKDKIFLIQSGTIDFTDPDEINPSLYISAESRINEYDISLLAQGTAKNLTIHLNSIPPLQEQDIISLIALGVTTSAMDQNVQSREQAQQLGAEIGGAVLAKPINKTIEATGFSLAVTSEYDSTRNISVPKITLSRSLSTRVKVSGSRPVGDSQSYDLKLEYLINSNFTAVGSFESRGNEDDTTLQTTQPASQSIFGLDLEFKREFK
ncbi:hypothetical protein AZI87_00245 [Bdellovibrio bacteriovorus]|uniref:Translocation and assembly module TamB C-terminal domain-containing protein n=1 Tax=Bdellovibrio bacteriovorus TaxID=959 RepID=A0A162GBQ9_BDEBC|nr:translocation/assembly module TamB [Bdellovibrio bacteriovorus]KYG67751.1 hypothetical protein AZI87_00245 [Bdellovibrio bacteriovorus]